MNEKEWFKAWASFQDANGNRDLGHAWAPPPSLTVGVLQALKDNPRLWLANAINIMGFGGSPPDNDFDADGKPNCENIAQRQRAAIALFASARRGSVKFSGSPAGSGNLSVPMPEDYFDTPRMLGYEDNTIEFDLDGASMEELAAASRNGERRGMYEKWWNVRVENASFVEWLTGELPTDPAETAPKIESKAPVAAPKPFPKLQVKIQLKADELWPDGGWPARVKDRDKAIIEAWPKGEMPPHPRTIQRAFAARTKQDNSRQSIVVR